LIREEALLLGPHLSLVGIYTPARPEAAAGVQRPAFVLLNAGLIHHAGPNRLHVRLARALSDCGIATLRFDLSGIGDSPARPDHLPAAELVRREPVEILDALAERGHDSVVLGGVCSGAAHALLAAGDSRVRGLVLINPAATTAEPATESQVSAQYYLRRSLRNPRAWLNLFTGRVKYGALFGTFLQEARRLLLGGPAKSSSMLDLVMNELEPARRRALPTLVVLSDRQADLLTLLGEDAAQLRREAWLQIEEHPETDHLFTSVEAQGALVREVCAWASQLAQQMPLGAARAELA
jgi:pimeloyl-ACP methyl ester carboxylesterase